jgi:uracil-DNA glycosylase
VSDLDRLRVEAAGCRMCDLWQNATQTVFGEGRATAEVIVVGEQPGDVEDKTGKPFVGPAGKLLDRAFEEAGIDRTKIYVTNAVKHFKFERKGKRRIHKKPSVGQIEACKPWLQSEIAAIEPKLVVCLGATAAQSLLGRTFKLTQHRGEVFRPEGLPPVTATVHPASILRAQDDESRHEQLEKLVADLRKAAKQIDVGPARRRAS